MTQTTSVLLVDDDEDVLKSICRLFFDNDDVELVPLTDPEAALDRLQTRDFDILLSDYRMPGMDGLELMRQAREHAPETVRVMISGQVDVANLAEAFNTGLITRFVLKPWQDEELIATLKHAQNTRLALDQSRLLTERYQVLSQEMDRLGRAVQATCLALRQDSVASSDAEILRRALRGDAPHG